MSISCPRPAQAEIRDDVQLFKLMLPHLTFFLDVTQRCDFMREELKDQMTQCSGTPRFQESWNGEGGSVAHVEMFGLGYMNLRCLVSFCFLRFDTRVSFRWGHTDPIAIGSPRSLVNCHLNILEPIFRISQVFRFLQTLSTQILCKLQMSVFKSAQKPGK